MKNLQFVWWWRLNYWSLGLYEWPESPIYAWSIYIGPLEIRRFRP